MLAWPTIKNIISIGASLALFYYRISAHSSARGDFFHSLLRGRLIFHIFGALRQFERDLIRERTRAGLDAATARGRRGGRRPVVTEEKLRRARTLMAQGLTVREVAARIKVGKTALYTALGPGAENAPDCST